MALMRAVASPMVSILRTRSPVIKPRAFSRWIKPSPGFRLHSIQSASTATKTSQVSLYIGGLFAISGLSIFASDLAYCDDKQAPQYFAGPLHQRLLGIGKGVLSEHTHKSDWVYKGHERKFWVYKPDCYDEVSAPAPFIVFQDGDGYLDESKTFSVLSVIDNLRHRGELPPNTVCVFVMPGKKIGEPVSIFRDGLISYLDSGRCDEYDSVDGRYAKFLIEELIPAVEEDTGLKLTSNPRLRCLIGHSSGGLCAFNAAFQRPDAFQLVLSHCGSFTKIKKGHELPFMVRKDEKKPIRVFLQSGSNDLDIAAGNWLLANKLMESALRFRGYDHQCAWGHGGHDRWHGTAILPESLRWLWRDWQDENA